MNLNTDHGQSALNQRLAGPAPRATAGTAVPLGPSFRRGGWVLLTSLAGWVCFAPVAGASPTPAQSALRVVSRSVTVRGDPHAIRFEVVFDRAPDFHSVDSEGRQADSFQFHLDVLPGSGGMHGQSPYPWECIVRGEEIHGTGRILIRDHVRGPSEEPSSGGWGPVVGSVAYTLDGAHQQFDIPFSLLGTTTGEINYSLAVYQHGVAAGEWSGTSEGSPDPVLADTVRASPGAVQASLVASLTPTWYDKDGVVTPDALRWGFVMAISWPIAGLAVGAYIVGARAISRHRVYVLARQDIENRKPGPIGVPVGRRVPRRARLV